VLATSFIQNSGEGEAEAIEDMEEWEQACPDRVGPKKEGIRKE
jgi:hypothetical protein